MNLLNHTCSRIKHSAIDILYLFFIDIDLINQKIKLILLANKNNFENYFMKMLGNKDVSEKSNFILYQLERLENSM